MFWCGTRRAIQCGPKMLRYWLMTISANGLNVALDDAGVKGITGALPAIYSAPFSAFAPKRVLAVWR
jgi:hypothetical protein